MIRVREVAIGLMLFSIIPLLTVIGILIAEAWREWKAIRKEKEERQK